MNLPALSISERTRRMVLAAGIVLGAAGLARGEDLQTAEESRAAQGGVTPGQGWFGTVQAGYVHQFETSMEDDGRIEADRFAIVGGVGYRPDFSRSVALTLGYDGNVYSFSSTSGGSPWDTIHGVKLGAPVRWGFQEDWTLFVIPTIRWTAETGADWSQSLSGGGFAGVSYRVGERLTIGPGFGALTQLEDAPSYFPVLIIAWEITDHLRLETGRGLGASQGPGLMLTYAPAPPWKFSLGGRYEKFRFRLADGGANPGGVGEDRGVPLYLGATWKWAEDGSLSLLGGIRLGGALELDDAEGGELSERDYDPAPFLGVTFDWSL